MWPCRHSIPAIGQGLPFGSLRIVRCGGARYHPFDPRALGLLDELTSAKVSLRTTGVGLVAADRGRMFVLRWD